MSSPNCLTSGSLSTDGTAYASAGLLHYVEIDTAGAGVLSCYDGSTVGKLLCTVHSSNTDGHINFTTPVQFGSSGLYITISTGTGLVHIS